ncbi:hypothetical protein BDV24DRAFT_145779, partial [Aspergillus arachidicola]
MNVSDHDSLLPGYRPSTYQTYNLDFRVSRMRFFYFGILQLSALSLATPSQYPADLEERQLFPPIGDGSLKCTAGGQYCCTWEGCQSCCLPYFCKTEIDAAQGY